MLTGKTVLLGVTGSIAAYKTASLASALKKLNADVHVLMTQNAVNFINPITFETLTGNKCLIDTFDRNFQYNVEHVALAKKADVVMVAPASANVIGTIAHGIADDMLTTTVMACRCKKIFAPAMNTQMFENPIVQDNLKTLEHYGCEVISPASGYLACGDTGQGKMPEPELLLQYILKEIAFPKDLEGKKVLVTLGPTREGWDDVRFWTNASTGTMGGSLAVGAWLRGAEVHAVCGPSSLWLPGSSLGEDFFRHDVCTAREMFETARELWPDMDAGIFTAAVADYSPEPYGRGKFKKEQAAQGFSLRFLPNTDILRTLAGERRDDQKIVGFAAESTESEEALADLVRRKLLSKGADMIVGNQISDGFGTATNRVFVADIQGREEHWAAQPKPDIAWNILNWLQSI